MKKLTLALATAALLSSAAYAQSASGKVDFIGEVNTAPCDVTVSGGGRVHLGSYTVASLTGENAAGEWGFQDIEFNNCELEAGTGNVTLPNVSIRIGSGAGDTSKTAVWKNLGTAKNVGIEIEVGGKAILPAGGTVDTKLGGINNTVQVAGRMVKTVADDATPGKVATNITFHADFK